MKKSQTRSCRNRIRSVTPCALHRARNEQPLLEQAGGLGREFVGVQPVAVLEPHLDGLPAECLQREWSVGHLPIALVRKRERLVDQRGRRRHAPPRQKLGCEGEVERVRQHEFGHFTFERRRRLVERARHECPHGLLVGRPVTRLVRVLPDRAGLKKGRRFAPVQRQELDRAGIRRRAPFDRLGRDDDVAFRHVAGEAADFLTRVGRDLVQSVDDHCQRPRVNEAAHEARFLHVVNDARDGDVDAVGAVARVKKGDRPFRRRRDLAQEARLAEPGIGLKHGHSAEARPQLREGDGLDAVHAGAAVGEIAELGQVFEAGLRDEVVAERREQPPPQRRQDEEQQRNEAGAEKLAGAGVPEEDRLDGSGPRKGDQEGRPEQRPNCERAGYPEADWREILALEIRFERLLVRGAGLPEIGQKLFTVAFCSGVQQR